MKDQIKSYLQRLNHGEALENVQADFVRECKDVDPSAIMQAEQEPVSYTHLFIIWVFHTPLCPKFIHLLHDRKSLRMRHFLTLSLPVPDCLPAYQHFIFIAIDLRGNRDFTNQHSSRAMQFQVSGIVIALPGNIPFRSTDFYTVFLFIHHGTAQLRSTAIRIGQLDFICSIYSGRILLTGRLRLHNMISKIHGSRCQYIHSKIQ